MRLITDGTETDGAASFALWQKAEQPHLTARFIRTHSITARVGVKLCYPRVCGSEVLCLLSWSGWARFLRPSGADGRTRALTDGEQHTTNPLSTPVRTTQSLSAEADPFVQGETMRGGSKGHRNDL